ncbi:MAG: hypothetical protein COC19_08350 [SAR86 cluster bacterium]|uniref:Uncharacterized protein n=1 Tax=SAR86 cluster bacterium TaxID=2030880 RepID=A0A2A4MFW5_9GAMM|nr:MAG: hypothetical protein COC19_08350 [SAR86 cluster bacterium]
MLCLLLLFVQSAELIHHHGSDSQNQFECEICLKFGSVEHSPGLPKLDFGVQLDTEILVNFVAFLSSSSAPLHRARAPPYLV